MALLKQSTVYNRAFLMVLSSDHVTGATGKAGTLVVNLSKAAAAFGAAAGAITEISAGWYKIALTTGDTGTLGDLAYDCTVSGCDPTDFCDQVVAVDFADSVRAGLTALPNANAAAASGLPVLGTNATAISFTGGMTISNASGDALALTSSGSNGNALNAAGNGTGAGIKATGGATGNGVQAVGGATSGSGIKSVGTAGNSAALELAGQGSAAGLQATGGATGSGMKLIGGGTSGHGLAVTTTSGDGFNITPTAGNGITATANGTSKHGIAATGGTGGTSDGLKAAAGTGGVDIRGAITGDITGALSGAVGSVTGAVGSVTGAVGSVTARVTANTDQWAGTTIPAPAVTGVPKVDLVDIAGATVSTSSAQLGVNAVQIGAAVPGSATIGTVTTTTTATNLTNAPTSGDLTSTMKTSVENAVWDAARSSHLATGVFGQLGQEILRDNTATAGAASTITLDASASTTVDQYKGDVLYIYSGAGAGQSRVISAYSAGRVATVVPAWVTTPDNTSKFILTAQRTPLVGTDTRVLTSADVSTSGETVAAVTGAVGSVTGAVASVTADVGITQGGADKVWSTTTRALTDKIGFALSSAGVQAIWDALTSALSTVGSIGKLLVTDLDAAISSRSTYAGGDTSGTTTLLGRLTSTRAGLLDNVDAAVSSRSSHSAADVWAVGTRTLTAFTFAVDITSAAVSLIWDKLLTGITTVSSIGKLIKDNLDAAISSRSTYSGGAVASVTAGVTVTTNNDKTGYQLSTAGVDDIWDEPTSGHTTAGTTGKALIDAGASGSDPWDALLPGSYAPGSAGDIVGNNLDVAVSSRSTYAGADTSGTTTLLGRLTSTRAGDLDNLDVAVSTRSSHSAADVWAVGTRTLTAFTIAVDITSAAVSSIWDKLLTGITTASTIGKLIKDNLDAAISTRLATSGYTAPDNSDITAIKAKTDNLPASPAAVSDIPTAAANASATWDAVRASHTTAGSFGQGVSSVQGNVTGSAASVTADVGITQAAADKAWATATRALTDKAGFALTSPYDPAKTAAQAGDAMALTSGERNSVADAALKRDWTAVSGEAARSTLNALRFLRNKWSFAGTTLTVTAEDDTTAAWTGEVTTSSSAQPITSVDPT